MSRTTVNVLLLILCVTLAATGQIAMKAGMNEVGEITGEALAHPGDLVVRVLESVWVVVGVLLYLISAIFWLVVLSRVPLSVAYPMIAIAYPVVVAFSWLLFGESVQWIGWVGVALIVAGVSVTAQGLKTGAVANELTPDR